ncbi:MAG TPA: hypothetical protein VIV60_03560 [Polyangiaceae bacterium]
MKYTLCRRGTAPNRCAFAMLLVAGLGCNDVSWPDPEYISSLRVLGVTANPPTLAPNATSELSLFCADGSGGPQSEPTCQVEVAWFGGCNNPPNNDPKHCFERYRPWGHTLASSVADTPTEQWPEGFVYGPKLQFQAPEDILSNELEVMGQTVKYGNSYVYFAACAGKLVTDPDVVERLPVACVDPSSGKRLGQDRFVVGFTTLYSYDGISSRNPELIDRRIIDRRFDAASLSIDCSSSGDCPDGFACSDALTCLPSVPPCSKNTPHSCEGHCLTFGVTPESFLLYRKDGAALAAPTKGLWLEYFTNAGAVPDDTSFALRSPQTNATDNVTDQGKPCVWWRAPNVATENAHIWIVVRDDRGGMATWDQRVLVR